MSRQRNNNRPSATPIRGSPIKFCHGTVLLPYAALLPGAPRVLSPIAAWEAARDSARLGMTLLTWKPTQRSGLSLAGDMWHIGRAVSCCRSTRKHGRKHPLGSSFPPPCDGSDSWWPTFIEARELSVSGTCGSCACGWSLRDAEPGPSDHACEAMLAFVLLLPDARALALSNPDGGARQS